MYEIMIASLDSDSPDGTLLAVDPKEWPPERLKYNLETFWAWNMQYVMQTDGPVAMINWK